MPRIETHDGALVVPTTLWQQDGARRRSVYDGGVCTAAGAPVALGQHFGGQHRNETRPATGLQPAARLAGRWLFGGWYREHFGHFVNESLGRLWAIPQGPGWDGIVFLRYGRDHAPAEAPLTEARGSLPMLQSFLDLLGIATRAVVAEAPVRVDSLVVPQQVRLTPNEAEPDTTWVLRHYLAEAALRNAGTDPALPEKIYVSRSRLPANKAKFILEEAVEENLARAGYAILHPQEMSLPAQVRSYAAARTIVFAEGSAVHMAVPFLGPGKRVGILWREGRPHPSIQAQLEASRLDALVEFGDFAGFLYSSVPGRPERGKPDAALLRKMQVLPDFDGMGRALEAGGLIPPGLWRSPDAAARAAAIEAVLAGRREARPKLEHCFVAGDAVPEALRRQRARAARVRAPDRPMTDGAAKDGAAKDGATREARRAARVAERRAARE